MKTSEKQELKDRVDAKQRELQSRLAELKADSRQGAREAIADIESRLAELKKTVASGWNNISEEGAARLNRWLKN